VKTLAFVLLAFFSLNLNALEERTYQGTPYDDTSDSDECALEVSQIRRDASGKILSFKAKIQPGALFSQKISQVYEIERADGFVTGFSSAPKESFSGYNGELSPLNYLRILGHLALGDTLNVELNEKGDLISAEYFPLAISAIFGGEERLCEFQVD